jgi:hypothetical protein
MEIILPGERTASIFAVYNREDSNYQIERDGLFA